MSATQQKRARPQGQAAKAARAEVQPETKTVEFRDLTLELPAELPKTFLWDVAASQDNVVSYFQLAQSLLRPEDVGDVRSALADSDEDAGEFTVALLNAMLEPYGLAMGESAASQSS